MVKSALFLYSRRKLRIPQLKEYYHAYVLLDIKNGRNGAVRNLETLFKTFCLINRFMPKRLISKWLDYNSMHFREKGVIMGDEFFFLACNSYDKTDLLEKRVKRPLFSLKKDRKSGTYHIDHVPVPVDPDLNLNKVLEVGIEPENVFFDVDNPVTAPPEVEVKKPVKKHSQSMRSVLRNPSLYDYLKQTVQIPDMAKTLRPYITVPTNNRPGTAQPPKNSNNRPDTAKPLKSSSNRLDTAKPSKSSSNRLDTAPSKNSSKRLDTAPPKSSSNRPGTAKSPKSSSNRPTTAGISRVSTAVSLPIKEKPFRIMTLREAAVRSYRPKDKPSYKVPVERYTRF